MKRFAVYARYSSDLQTDKSIEDQLRECEQFVLRERGTVAQFYIDRAMSGASRFRPGYQSLLMDVAKGKFDCVFAEALDRLSRDQEDLAYLFKQLRFHGVELVTLAEGEVNELHVGLKGTMNALYLKDLAIKTRRGLEGLVRKGKSAGGRSYGYEVVKDFDAAGSPITGLLRINADEASVVQRIFETFADGKSPRQIAKTLNGDNIAGPRGGTWTDTAIRGHVKRGTGILNNERYVGRVIWNRQRFIKDPRTGKRVSRMNSEGEWVVQDTPELRIISDNLWKSVKARQELIERLAPERCETNLMTGSRRIKYLLSGLLVCGECGGGYTITGTDRYGCANHKNRGSCTNRTGIKRQEIEAKILSSLQTKLLEPEFIQRFIESYLEELHKQESLSQGEQKEARRELRLIEKKLHAIMHAIEQGIITETTKARLIELEKKKAELGIRLANDHVLPRPDPSLAAVYQEKVRMLASAIYAPEIREAAIDSLRPLINKIILKPGTGNSMNAELYGDITGLVTMEDTDSRDGKLFSLSSRVSVVAGGGFEPPTFRL